MQRITSKREFLAFKAAMGVRQDWHEPDEQDLTARVEGSPLAFDNAGFWPVGNGELHVIFSRLECDDEGVARRGPDLACVNLATLCAWATEYEGDG